MGRKAGDKLAVPLCWKHHTALHAYPLGEEKWWLLQTEVDPIEENRKLWETFEASTSN